MKISFIKTSAAILVIYLITALFISCADSGLTQAGVTTEPDATTQPEETQLSYDYPDADYEGYEFMFLGQSECNWANCIVVPEELNGELINDALYNRNKAAEERLNIKISFYGAATKESISPELAKTITAADDVYDAVFFPQDEISGSLTKGYFINLAELEPLALDQPWWDNIVIEMGTIDNKLYFASSDISLFPFEATWVVYFNETMMDNLSLEYPYGLAENGKWTIDRLTEYAKAAMNLNGDASYAYNTAGSAQYGVTSHSQFMQVLLIGSRETLISKDENGLPYFSGDNERFYNIISKIVALTGIPGQYTDRANMKLNNAENSLSTEFKNSRFMFLSETLGHISNLRDFDDEFGVLPAPKFDEEQPGYNSMIATWGTLLTVIPVTATDSERTATILDLMSYQSYVSLMEPYYDTYLTQKGARNNESAEMLSIIRDTRTLAAGNLFGWTTELENTLCAKLITGNGDIASSVAAAVKSVKIKIENTLSAISG